MTRRTSRIAALAIVFLLGLIGASPALAASSWTAPSAVAGSAGTTPGTVAVDRSGTAYLATTVDTTTVRVLRRTASGSWSHDDVEAGAQDTVSSGSARLALGPDDQPTVVWAGGVDAPGAYTASRTAGGTWSTTRLSNSSSTSTPRVVVDRFGATTAVWSRLKVLFAAHRPAGGSWPADIVANPVTVATATSNLTSSTALAVDAAGWVTAVWRDAASTSATATGTLRSAVLDGTSPSPSWTAAKDVTPAGSVVPAPQLAVSADGSATVAWGNATSGTISVAQRPAANVPTTQAWTAPSPVGAGTASIAAVASDDQGQATVAWSSVDVGSATLTTRTATAAKPGDPWGVPQPALTASGVASPGQVQAPVLVADPAGDVVVVSSHIAGDGSVPVRASRRPAGGSWSPASERGDGLLGATPLVAGDALGNVTVVSARAAGDGTDLASSELQAVPDPATSWTAYGLGASSTLRSWLRYVHGGGSVSTSGQVTSPNPSTFRLAVTGAGRDATSGETVVRYQGTIRFEYPQHFIDLRLTDPRLVIAADGTHAKLFADGIANGSMADAMAPGGSLQLIPFRDLHVLDLDLTRAGQRVSGDGAARSWVLAPSTLTAEANAKLQLSYADRPFGLFTVTVPTSLPTLPTDGGGTPPVAPPTDPPLVPSPPAPGPAPAPPAVIPKAPVAGQPKGTGVTGKVSGRGKAQRRVAVVVSRRLGASARTTYRVTLTKGKRTIATGTLRDRTLKLTVRNVAKRGKRASYPRLKGSYRLQSAAGVKRSQRIAATALTLR